MHSVANWWHNKYILVHMQTTLVSLCSTRHTTQAFVSTVAECSQHHSQITIEAIQVQSIHAHSLTNVSIK